MQARPNIHTSRLCQQPSTQEQCSPAPARSALDPSIPHCTLAGYTLAWWCKGSTGDFDSPSPGSNPGRAATFEGLGVGPGFEPGLAPYWPWFDGASDSERRWGTRRAPNPGRAATFEGLGVGPGFEPGLAPYWPWFDGASDSERRWGTRRAPNPGRAATFEGLGLVPRTSAAPIPATTAMARLRGRRSGLGRIMPKTRMPQCCMREQYYLHCRSPAMGGAHRCAIARP